MKHMCSLFATHREAAKNAKDKNIKIVSIGIGNSNDQELTDMASDPKEDFKFYVDQFTLLNTIQEKIVRTACTRNVYNFNIKN